MTFLNTNTKEYREKVAAYLCESLYDFEGDRAARVQRLWDKFNGEMNYPYNRKRTPNVQARVAEWLSGLPLNIAYSFHDIRQIAEQWNESALTEKEAEKVVFNWFNFLAFKLIQLWQSHKINVYGEL